MNRPSYRNIQALLDIMAKLRAPDGCPWDKKQTHSSILNCLIEEAYEFVDAVENGDVPNMKEELGDLLLQVVFHAQMAQEGGTFDFADIVEVISEKLVRRHPHVFGEAQVETAEGVQKQWDEIKQQEKSGKGPAQPEGPLGSIPKGLPALLKAEKIQKRAAQTGFDWPDWRGPWDKVVEELGELKEVAEQAAKADPAGTLGSKGPGDPDRLESEFGDLLFAAVNLGRFFKLDPEKALARANRKFMDRYAAMEKLAETDGVDFPALSLEEKETYWVRVKKAGG